MKTTYHRIERDGPVVVMTLSNGERMNPLAVPMQAGLLDELRRLGDDPAVRCLVLTGEGRGFCAGADLSSMRQAPNDSRTLGESTAEWMDRLTNQIVVTMRHLPFPVVSAVNGACAGAGVGLALSADIVLAARSAYFYLPFMPKLGIVPDMGTTWFYEHLLGRARATALTLLGERLSAEQAAAWGLIWASVDDAQLQATAISMAARLARLPLHAARETRAASENARSSTLAEQLEYERNRQRELLDAPDFREGVLAFLEKREPEFGRPPLPDGRAESNQQG